MLKFFKRKVKKGKKGKCQVEDPEKCYLNPMDIPLILDSLMINLTIEELKIARLVNHTWNSCALLQFHLRNDKLRPINLTRSSSILDQFHQDLSKSLKPTLFRNFKIGLNFGEEFFERYQPTHLEILFKTFCEQNSGLKTPKNNLLYEIGHKVIDSDFNKDFKTVFCTHIFQNIKYFSDNLRSISLGGFFNVKVINFEEMISSSEVKFRHLEEVSMCFYTDWDNHETVDFCQKILTFIMNNSVKCISLILTAIPHNLRIFKIFEDFNKRVVPNLTKLSLKTVYDPNYILDIPQDLHQLSKHHGLCLKSLKNEVYVSRARSDDNELEIPSVVQTYNKFLQFQEKSLQNLDISIINWFQPNEQNLIDLSNLHNLTHLSIKLRKSHFGEEFTTILKSINLEQLPLLKRLKLIEFDNYSTIFYGVSETMKYLSLIECTPKKFTSLPHQFPNLHTIEIQSLASGPVKTKMCKKCLSNWAHSLEKLILVGEISEVELKTMNLKKFLQPLKGLKRLELTNIDWGARSLKTKGPEISIDCTFLSNLKIQSLAVKNIKMTDDAIKKLHKMYKFEYIY